MVNLDCQLLNYFANRKKKVKHMYESVRKSLRNIADIQCSNQVRSSPPSMAILSDSVKYRIEENRIE